MLTVNQLKDHFEFILHHAVLPDTPLEISFEESLLLDVVTVGNKLEWHPATLNDKDEFNIEPYNYIGQIRKDDCTISLYTV